MKKYFKMLFHRDNGSQRPDSEFAITRGLPLPIRKVTYNDQLRVIKTLEKLPKGGSFPINNELDYTVRKMAREYYPEYKISIRKVGATKRVYREE